MYVCGGVGEDRNTENNFHFYLENESGILVACEFSYKAAICKGQSGLLLFCLCFIKSRYRGTFKNKAESLITICNKSFLKDEIIDTQCTQRVFNIFVSLVIMG